jgi:nitronate monooxygenase
MKLINAIRMGGSEILPLVEGGKGVAVSTGISAGHWAAAGGIGTFSAVNADSYDQDGHPIPQIYHGKTRRERHEELVAYAIQGGIVQAQRAHEIAGGQGRIHANILWEMGAAERVITGILEGAKGLINGLTCGAGMPYRLSEIAARFNVHYYPIVSSARAFNALWRRAYHKVSGLLGGVVYEDPWLAGGHNGLSNNEDPLKPESPLPRVLALRRQMREFGLGDTPIIMAGGVWWLEEWEDWIDNPDLGPIAFQFGTRPLVTRESPISESWKQRLLHLQEGDISLNKFSPTGFYSSAVNNAFLQDLRERSDRQVAFTAEPVGAHTAEYGVGPRKRVRLDQINCMGCLSHCRFSNWSQEGPEYSTGKKTDPRSFCIQKTLQEIVHDPDNPETLEHNLMFSGHNAYRFASDPFYSNGFIPTVKELVDRIMTGR